MLKYLYNKKTGTFERKESAGLDWLNPDKAPDEGKKEAASSKIVLDEEWCGVTIKDYGDLQDQPSDGRLELFRARYDKNKS